MTFLFRLKLNIVNSGSSGYVRCLARTRTADFETTVLAPPTESVFPNIERRFLELSHPEFLSSAQYPQVDHNLTSYQFKTDVKTGALSRIILRIVDPALSGRIKHCNI